MHEAEWESRGGLGVPLLLFDAVKESVSLPFAEIETDFVRVLVIGRAQPKFAEWMEPSSEPGLISHIWGFAVGHDVACSTPGLGSTPTQTLPHGNLRSSMSSDSISPDRPTPRQVLAHMHHYNNRALIVCWTLCDDRMPSAQPPNTHLRVMQLLISLPRPRLTS